MDSNRLMKKRKKLKRICKDYEKSFATHPNSKYWCYELNNGIKPRHVFLNCNERFWFKCEKCEHKFNLFLSNMISNQWLCPYCSHIELLKNKKWWRYVRL